MHGSTVGYIQPWLRSQYIRHSDVGAAVLIVPSCQRAAGLIHACMLFPCSCAATPNPLAACS